MNDRVVELEEMRTALLEVHVPRWVSSPHRPVCSVCAQWMGTARGLKRVGWPCRTARLLGVGDE